MKIQVELACLLACLVVVGVGCPLAEPAGTPEEWSHWIDRSDSKLNEYMIPSMAAATEADHHAFWAQSHHPTGILTSLPDHAHQAGSQSTDAAEGRGATPWKSLKAIEDFLINQPDEGKIMSEYYNASPSSGASLVSEGLQHLLDRSPSSPALASSHSASPYMITTTTTTTNKSKRKIPLRIERPLGSPIKNQTSRPRGSLAALPITQLSAGPRLDLIPFHSDIQYDHRQPSFDSASEPPSQGRPRKRNGRPQRALDEPTHLALGSVQGREILPAEPPVTLPPQALITFDVSLFQPSDSDGDASRGHHLQQIQIGVMRQIIEATPNKLLIIPEENLLERCLFYYSCLHTEYEKANRHEGSNTDRAKKARTVKTLHENQQREKVKEFHGHVDFWYYRWFANTGTQFKIDSDLPHYKFLSPPRRVTIHSLYLFYVEMISSIIARKPQSNTHASELKSAHEAFERLSKAANERAASRGDEQSFNNVAVEGSVGEEADKLLNKTAAKLKDQNAGRGFISTFPPLWTYLEFWIDTKRPGILKHPGVDVELPASFKEFFNAVFLYSYTALYKRCFPY
ncbi:uncharacterized protein VP01_2945g3 [Puccinia sorghi]|uniref:Uncharacterized protein n=1 Tax=Puccinia sorghi TaxID=27349 RepID=A0A0L6V1T3_9BASI|nr:uncharacterized protein VP01_2945g3 [Puccinia sorghi]